MSILLVKRQRKDGETSEVVATYGNELVLGRRRSGHAAGRGGERTLDTSTEGEHVIDAVELRCVRFLWENDCETFLLGSWSEERGGQCELLRSATLRIR